MRKILLFTLAIVVACTTAMAADVDLTKAQSVARAFMSKQVANGRLRAAAASNLKLVKAESSVAKPSAVDYYIFNADKSYVVVAGDDLAPEVLMYGEEGTIDINDIPPAMQWLLNKYKYQIDGLKAGTLKPNGYTPKATTAVPPMVTANWDQSAPYYNHTPTSGSSHAVTGCPATSLSMCYYRWKWPKTFPACARIPASSDYYGTYLEAPAIESRAADWDNIIDEYTGPSNYNSTTAQKDAVAWLMRYAGQTIPEYQYSTSASGATDPNILQGLKNMGYTDARLLTLTKGYAGSNQYYTDAQWNEWMLAELHAGRPIEYLASDRSAGGHAFNVFGCDTNGKYYVNWGWSGDSNGYCTLHNFTTATGSTGQSGTFVFNYGEAMIIGIAPPAGALGPNINVNPSSLSFSASAGNSQTKTIAITGSNLTSDVTVSLNDPNDKFSISVDGINATINSKGNVNLKGTGSVTIPVSSISTTSPVNVNVTFKGADEGTSNATLTIVSDGAETKTISLKATVNDGNVPDGYAQVTLTVGDVWGDGSGYQMLLDADHNAYGTTIPTTGGLTSSGNATAATYAEFEYKIPENADGALTTQNIVINASVTILIPAGTYDWCITNPTPGDRIWIASTNGNVGGRQDDFEFESGKSYEFIVSLDGSNDRVDVNPAGIPAIVNAEPTATTSEVTWTPGQFNDSWNLRYRPYVDIVNTNRLWDFPVPGYEDQLAEGFVIYDADGDGKNWDLTYTNNDSNTDACFYSDSWTSSDGSLTPDNYLITPNVTLGGTLKFKAWNESSLYKDKFSVYVMYNDGEDHLVALQTGISPGTTPQEYTFSLSNYSGIGQIVFRHHDSDDMMTVYLDDIEVVVPNPTPIFEWIYVNDVESPYTITGLTPETTYEVQVQGVNEISTSAWTASTLFTTLAEATLATIEGSGTKGELYTISDALVAVYADADNGLLWCKDQGNKSIIATEIAAGQIDFMRDATLTGTTGQGTRDWDQSNWVVLKFPGSDQENGVAALLNDAVKDNKVIAAKTVTGRYIDDANYTIEVQPVNGAYTLTFDGSASYVKNVYCVANFLESNTNFGENTGAVGAHDDYYFFMNPKIQEICHITYAMWDGEMFTTPSNTEIPGAFTVGWGFNTTGGVAPTLESGETYQFDAIVAHPATRGGMLRGEGTPSDNYMVYPTNLTGSGNIITAINGIYMDGSREVVGIEYVNSLGQVGKRPFSGVNIVVTRYSDGTTTAAKKVFK